MRFTPRYCFLIIPAALVAGMLVSGCENSMDEVKRLTTFEKLPAQTVLNSHITYTDSGLVTFEIKAGRIDRFPGEEPIDTFSGGIEVISYDEYGNFESQVNAENAVNLPKQKLMVARDSVRLRNYEGKVLETELLTWDDNTGMIYTDKFVTITTPTEILYGYGLNAKQDFSFYEILDIRGTIIVEDEEEDEETTEPETE